MFSDTNVKAFFLETQVTFAVTLIKQFIIYYKSFAFLEPN